MYALYVQIVENSSYRFDACRTEVQQSFEGFNKHCLIITCIVGAYSMAFFFFQLYTSFDILDN